MTAEGTAEQVYKHLKQEQEQIRTELDDEYGGEYPEPDDHRGWRMLRNLGALDTVISYYQRKAYGWTCNDCDRDNRKDTQYCAGCGVKKGAEEVQA